MLLQVTIENFRCFREPITFSMLGVNIDQTHVNHLAVDAVGEGKSLLPVAAIYGANAAGKSNLIEAIGFAKDLIVEGTRSGKIIPVSPFKLGDGSEKNSKFEFIFTYQNTCYSYGFTLKPSQILEEWLYVIDPQQQQEVLYFERITAETGETQVEYGEPLKGKNDENQQFLDFIAKGTRSNQLFLTEAVDRNVDRLVPIIKWFERVLTIIPAESRFIGLGIGILSSEEFTSFLSGFLKFAGTGIESIGIDEVTVDFDYHFPDMPEEMRDELHQQLAEAGENSVLMMDFGKKRYLLMKGEQEQISLMQIKTKHRHQKGQLVDFSIEEESEGTQRLINLIPILFSLKNQSEKVILLDELDRRLHPLLSRQFLQFFLQGKAEDMRNQLIFTTHDTNLLDLDILRRDEIWFLEKNQQGASHLYSLAEFKIPPDIKIDKGYLNGRFGAIPFFGDIHSLGWLDADKKSSGSQTKVEGQP